MGFGLADDDQDFEVLGLLNVVRPLEYERGAPTAQTVRRPNKMTMGSFMGLSA